MGIASLYSYRRPAFVHWLALAKHPEHATNLSKALATLKQENPIRFLLLIEVQVIYNRRKLSLGSVERHIREHGLLGGAKLSNSSH